MDPIEVKILNNVYVKGESTLKVNHFSPKQNYA